MSKIFNGEFQAAAFIGRAHTLYREGYKGEAEQWADHAKRMFYDTNSHLLNDELEIRYSEFLNHVLDLAYECDDQEFVGEIERKYGQHLMQV